ncbi:AraC family transcriptional regulator [Mycolicibacterium helvum]|uniref:HTH araC/xylS-type domain-containing protein n=1 Tax=Mycolicibacterium helvum TaxID=1534349 RepID=A0A7I7SY17_9MYCO|nr:AraC family transcriptional regulator [Mycolicibacterium helvum]BBY61922.1 hypothetical protein MHEL_01650 [Mycolicibacterium helvum]
MADDARITDSARTRAGALESLATGQLDPGQARGEWSETLNRHYGELDVEWPRADSSFEAQWTGRAFGDLHISTIHAQRHGVVRSPAMISSDGVHDYLVGLIVDGQAEITQNGRTAQLGPGSFVILDSAQPFRYSCPTDFRQIVLTAPRALLTARLPDRSLRSATARTVSGTSGAGVLVTSVFSGIADIDSDISPASTEALVSSALDILVTAMTEAQLPLSAPATARDQDLAVAKHAIVRHLHQPDFSIGDVAAELGMSVRYVQKLFAAEGSSPSTWQLEQRVERARKYLLTTNLTVSEISSQVGFRDPSHFSRRFRHAFAVNPQRFRNDHRGASVEQIGTDPCMSPSAKSSEVTEPQ